MGRQVVGSLAGLVECLQLLEEQGRVVLEPELDDGLRHTKESWSAVSNPIDACRIGSTVKLCPSQNSVVEPGFGVGVDLDARRRSLPRSAAAPRARGRSRRTGPRSSVVVVDSGSVVVVDSSGSVVVDGVVAGRRAWSDLVAGDAAAGGEDEQQGRDERIGARWRHRPV